MGPLSLVDSVMARVRDDKRILSHSRNLTSVYSG
jgi:hypothetical protein